MTKKIKPLEKTSRDKTVMEYAKAKRLDPVSFLRGWNTVKNKGEKK